jgi:indole-3-glycerol phosphate synthase
LAASEILRHGVAPQKRRNLRRSSVYSILSGLGQRRRSHWQHAPSDWLLTRLRGGFRIIGKLKMLGSLESIVAAARRRVSENRSSSDLRELERAAAEHHPRGFYEQLRRTSQAGIAVIAELKKASPSKGLIRADFQPAALARSLEAAGATALSVLTDEEFFQGSLAYLRHASDATHLPCLRKDFIVDRSQVLEARANRADAILLIVAALEQTELRALAEEARRHNLDVLCEAHSEDELQRALDTGCDLIGINSRDLRTFQVDLATAFRLAEKIPTNCLRVAESGIHSGADMARLRAAGYDAFLIGESLMRAEHPEEALKKLMEEAMGVASG